MFLTGSSAELTKDGYYGTSLIGEKDENIVYSIYDGLPHSSMANLCLGGNRPPTVDGAFNYYWRSNFDKKEFSANYTFNKSKKCISLNIPYSKNAPSDDIFKYKFVFIKHGKEILVTDNKKFKNKATHILNMDVSKTFYKETSRPFEFYIL